MKAKAQANRKNSLKSTGPRNTASTRFNSIKHGLTAVGVSKLDGDDYTKLLRKITSHLQPNGPIEQFLVQRICLCMIRLERACKLEAAYLNAELKSPLNQSLAELPDLMVEQMSGKHDLSYPYTQGSLSLRNIDVLINKFQRYETAIENKLYRGFNQFEQYRHQRLEKNVSPYSNSEDRTHKKDGPLASFGNTQ